jgi:hypothetical protein
MLSNIKARSRRASLPVILTTSSINNT